MMKKTNEKAGKFKKLLYKKLVAYFEKNVNKESSIHDIAEYCHVSRHNYSILKEVLNNMVEEKEISTLENGNYIRQTKQNLVVGKLRLTGKGAGFVRIENSDEEIFIKADEVNMAFQNDRVVVEVLASSKGNLREGKIISVKERAYNQFPGIYHKTKYYSYTAPIDRRLRKEFLIPEVDSLGAVDGQIVVFELADWPENEINPVGRIIKILGWPEDGQVDLQALMVSYGVGADFAPEVLREAEQKQISLTQEEISGRLDLRELTLFTIDPDDAKDFDDAVSLEILDNGNWYLGVHIADVSHFVPENSELDKSAYERGCSVYLVDRVLPMLPEFLSNDLCSLKPNEDRFSFSCFMELNREAELVSYEIKPSVINSKRRFNYDEVQKILDQPQNKDEYAELLKTMWELAKQLNKNRLKSGAMDFDTPEVKFILDDKGFPIDILPKPRLDSMRLIEEFMLEANKTVARHIDYLAEKRLTFPFLYRVHEKPSVEKITRFVEFMKALGYNIDGDHLQNVKNFQAVLEKVHGTPEINLIEDIALRSMMKAMYATKNIGHYGLGFSHYTHFTSPIRRYPDLWVHRLLKEYDTMVGKQRISALKTILKSVADQSNSCEVNAQQAERDSIKLKQMEYLSQYVGDEFDGLISGVTEFGIFVELNDTLIEGLVHIRDMEDDYYIYEEAAVSLVGRHKKHRYRMGDKVRIKVVAVNKENRNIDFLLVSREEKAADKKIIKRKPGGQKNFRKRKKNKPASEKTSFKKKKKNSEKNPPADKSSNNSAG